VHTIGTLINRNEQTRIQAKMGILIMVRNVLVNKLVNVVSLPIILECGGREFV
jgi:hypothetical protein